jgi:superfamily II DNA or RNA helicase
MAANIIAFPPTTDFQLRPYQIEAVDAVLQSWQEHQRVLLVLPTGSGKTVIFAAVAKKRLEAGMVLVLAHTDELIDQARDKMRRANGLESDLEKAENRASLKSPLVVTPNAAGALRIYSLLNSHC